MELVLLAIVFLIVIVLGGYLFNRPGPGDFIRDPEVKPRRNNWVP